MITEIEKQCSTCIHWIDFCQFYEDLEEPNDAGFCQHQSHRMECMMEDDTCDFWEMNK